MRVEDLKIKVLRELNKSFREFFPGRFEQKLLKVLLPAGMSLLTNFFADDWPR